MSEMDAILRTIREVETSLERRHERAGGLVMMTWGIVATAIFLFYASMDLADAPLDMIPLARWAWVPPIVVGYLITALVQVRLGRAHAGEGAPGIRRLLVLLLVPLALLVLAELTGFGYQLIPAMWVAFLGYMHLSWHAEGAHRNDKIIAAASFVFAAVLMLPPVWAWANVGAGIWYAIFLAGHGAYRYYASR